MVGFDPYVRAAEIACVTWLVCRFIGALVAALGGSRDATTRLKLAALPAVLLTAAYWGASLVPPPTAVGRLSPQNLLSALLLMTLAAYGLRGRRRRGVDDAEDEVDHETEFDAGATPEPARYAAAVSLSLLPLVATGAAVFITDDADSASEAEAAATAPVWEVMTDDPAAWDDRIRDARRRVFVEPWDASAVRVLGYAHLARGHAEEAARASRIARSLGASAESLMPLEVEALTLEGDCDAAKALYESTLAAYYGSVRDALSGDTRFTIELPRPPRQFMLRCRVTPALEAPPVPAPRDPSTPTEPAGDGAADSARGAEAATEAETTDDDPTNPDGPASPEGPAPSAADEGAITPP